MALHSISGNFTVVYNNGILPNIDNDGGSIRHAGTIGADDTTLWNSMRLGDDTYDNNFTLVVSGVGGAEAVNNQGVFGGGDHVIRLVTTDIAGIDNTTFQVVGSNAASRSNSIKALRAHRNLSVKLGIQANAWDGFNATWDAGHPQNATSGIFDLNLDTDVSATAETADVAANPSRAVPGRFVFLVGGNVLTSGDYSAKNG